MANYAREKRKSQRGDLSERLANIPLLLAERPRTAGELAAVFGVTKKSIRRDLTALSKPYPITEERDGREVRYRYGDGYKFDPPPFTPGELATLLLAQESIAATGLTALGAPFGRYGQSLLAKVRAVLPTAVRDKFAALSRVYGSAAVPAKDFAPHADLIERLTAAATSTRRVCLRYYTLATDTDAERTVEPYAVYFDPDGATLKLIGFDHRRHKIIPFAIDHIRSLRETNEAFTRPADFNLEDYLAEHCFNGIHGEPVDLTLRAYGVTARVLAERRFHRSQRVLASTRRTARREENITVSLRVAGGRGLLRFLLGWGAGIEVLSPPSLRRELAAAHRHALAHYDGDDEGAKGDDHTNAGDAISA